MKYIISEYKMNTMMGKDLSIVMSECDCCEAKRDVAFFVNEKDAKDYVEHMNESDAVTPVLGGLMKDWAKRLELRSIEYIRTDRKLNQMECCCNFLGAMGEACSYHEAKNGFETGFKEGRTDAHAELSFVREALEKISKDRCVHVSGDVTNIPTWTAELAAKTISKLDALIGAGEK